MTLASLARFEMSCVSNMTVRILLPRFEMFFISNETVRIRLPRFEMFFISNETLVSPARIETPSTSQLAPFRLAIYGMRLANLEPMSGIEPLNLFLTKEVLCRLSYMGRKLIFHP